MRGFFNIDNKYLIETQEGGENLVPLLGIAFSFLEDNERSAQVMAQAVCNAVQDSGEERPEILYFDRNIEYSSPVAQISIKNQAVLVDEGAHTFEELRAFAEAEI